MTTSTIPIAPEQAKAQGIKTKHEQMPNGEIRYRLISNDGSAYIRTVATGESGWQNSHVHKFVKETYIVQKGIMILAEKATVDGEPKLRLRKFTPSNPVVTSQPHVAHNTYMYPDTVTHTVKHGTYREGGIDWTADVGMDFNSKRITKKKMDQLFAGEEYVDLPWLEPEV